MQLGRAGLTLGLSILVGCGGTFTQQGDSGGGSAGTGSTAGTAGDAGSGGSVSKGGTGSAGSTSYGAYGGDAGGYGGDAGGYGNYGGDVSYGAYGGDISPGGYSGDAGAFGGDAGAFGGDAGAGGGCGPATTPSGPYSTEFIFSSNTPVYLKADCLLNYDLHSCNSGSSPIRRDASCIADCSTASAGGCLECGACASDAKLVGPGASLDDWWDGRIYTYGTLPAGCTCATAANAAPGVYSITVSAFLSESDAMTNTNPYPHQVTFELPAPNGVVSVDLGFQGI